MPTQPATKKRENPFTTDAAEQLRTDMYDAWKRIQTYSGHTRFSDQMLSDIETLIRAERFLGPVTVTFSAVSEKRGGSGDMRHASFFHQASPVLMYQLVHEVRRLRDELEKK